MKMAQEISLTDKMMDDTASLPTRQMPTHSLACLAKKLKKLIETRMLMPWIANWMTQEKG